jgi:hypothetical protein
MAVEGVLAREISLLLTLTTFIGGCSVLFVDGRCWRVTPPYLSGSVVNAATPHRSWKQSPPDCS